MIDANFMEWLRNLRIVLKAERIAYVLDGPLQESHVVDASDKDHNTYQKHLVDNVIATYIMLTSMSPELQKQHEFLTAHVIIIHLKELFYEQVRSKRFNVSAFSLQVARGDISSTVCIEDEWIHYKVGSVGFWYGL